MAIMRPSEWAHARTIPFQSLRLPAPFPLTDCAAYIVTATILLHYRATYTLVHNSLPLLLFDEGNALFVRRGHLSVDA